MSRKVVGCSKVCLTAAVKGLCPSDGRIDVQLHVSALNLRDAEEITTGLRVEFCRINGLRGPSAANVYLS
ncbi:cold shock-like protein CspF [Escherichia coli]|nr:cold shock-like protein CspF [Escherichia coli]